MTDITGPRRRAVRAVVAAVVAVSTAVGLVAVDTGPAGAQAAPDEIVVEGLGSGHGRGMGQFGALGYAIDFGWTHSQILNHFYGNTTAGFSPNEDIKVHITAIGTSDLIVYSPNRFTVAGQVAVEPGTAVRMRVIGDGRFRVERGPGCGGPWNEVLLADVEGQVGQGRDGNNRFIEAVPDQAGYGDDLTGTLIACYLDGDTAVERAFRGSLRLVEQNELAVTINRLPLEQYLRGVVPRESPASWGRLPSGEGIDLGIEALEAQAVAARSYALALTALRRARGSFASDTCDTQACQVYLGAWTRRSAPSGVTERALDWGPDNETSNVAIARTAGEVRLRPDGTIALTEFSSSTGGYTSRQSEGNGFPAVIDEGDRTATTCAQLPGTFSCNPHRPWTTTISRSSIERAYPQIGTLTSIRVTQRNGLGQWGGRVQQIEVAGTARTIFIDIPNWAGDTFRRGFGLKSDWYRFPQFEVQPALGDTGAGIGFWVAKSDGTVDAYGSAPFLGDVADVSLARPIVGMAANPAGAGYWTVADDGGVFAHGGAPFHGSAGDIALDQPIVGMAATPTGRGYWLVAADGGIFSYGDAGFHGSMGGIPLVSPMVGMASSPTGRGYWTVAADGGIFAFGDATFYGSIGGRRLDQPVVGMAPTPTGAGYWFVASDGGIFSFGDATFFGSRAGRDNRAPVIGMASSPSGEGYWIVTSSGTSWPFGAVPDHPSSRSGETVVAVVADPG